MLNSENLEEFFLLEKILLKNLLKKQKLKKQKLKKQKKKKESKATKDKRLTTSVSDEDYAFVRDMALKKGSIKDRPYSNSECLRDLIALGRKNIEELLKI